MYKILSKTVEDIPFSFEKIPEVPHVQASLKKFLKAQGYETVKREQRPFHVPFTGRSFKQRVDVIAFQDDEIVIVECKGAPLDKLALCSAILQLSIYLRLYHMSTKLEDPQLFFEGLRPGLVRDGHVTGVLAFPCTTFSEATIGVVDQTFDGLNRGNLLEPNLEIWLLMCDDWPEKAKQSLQRL